MMRVSLRWAVVGGLGVVVAVVGAFVLGRATDHAMAQLEVYHHVRTIGPPSHNGMVAGFAIHGAADGGIYVWFPAGSWEDCRVRGATGCLRSNPGSIITSTCLATAKPGSYVDVAILRIDPVDGMDGIFTGAWVRCLAG